MLKRIHLPLSTHSAAGLFFGICAIYINFILLCCCLLLITTVFIKRQWSLKIFSTLLLSIVIGNYLHQQQINEFHDFKSKVNLNSFNVAGTVVDYNRIDNSAFKYRLIFCTDLFENQNKKINANKLIAVYTKKLASINIGEQIILKDLNFNFSGETNFENYLIKNQLTASVFTSELSFEKTKLAPAWSFAKYRQMLLKKINYTMSDRTKIMFNSIFLGYKPENKNETLELKNKFQFWGIIHYLARSGLHLAIISTMWQTICTVLTIPILYSNLITLFFVLLFYLLTWSALPFIRALVLIACYRVCHFLEIQVHLLHLLNLSCIAILIYNPIALFFLDFQLSFILTYGLVFLNEITHAQKMSFPRIY